jgi:2-amino-4-hydroxy-6-hydroxymethyldihydropteridine diphosphokinase
MIIDNNDGNFRLVYLSLGSNIEPRADYLDKARVAISQNIGAIIRGSNIYQTAPWHCQNPQDDYLNQVLCVGTVLNPQEILAQCLAIEKILGRDRSSDSKSSDSESSEIANHYQPRTIDIDLLVADVVLDSKALTLPHPRLHLRRFVLVPMEEIASEVVVFPFGKTVTQLLGDCPDQHHVSIYSDSIVSNSISANSISAKSL